MATKRTLFNEQWLDLTLYPDFAWLRKSKDAYHGFCVVCKKDFGLGNMGRKAVTTHNKGQLHQKLVKLNNSQPNMKTFLTSSQSSSETCGSVQESSDKIGLCLGESKSESAPGPSTQAGDKINQVSSFCYKGDVTKAEITWALNVVQNKLSLSSCTNISTTFKNMFPDSSIASKFQLGETKCSYMINHGLAPYFDSELKDQVRCCPDFVVCFDEALNKVVQRCQMDLFVRYFDINKNMVRTRYYNSVFLGSTTAENLFNGFNECLTPLHKKSILQVCMDGPNVNLSFMKKLGDQLKEEYPDEKQLVNIGVCGLHVVHGAMKTGMNSVQWQLSTFLRDIYYLFNDSPARRAEYTSVSGSNVFPLRFCSTRWLDNVKCLERALQIIDHITKFINKSKVLQTKPYAFVAENINDKFLKCKLAFYKTVSSDCEPFLRRFQSAEPLAPYLYSQLCNLMKTLLSRIVKSSKLNAANTALKLVSIDLNESDNLLQVSNIDLGFQTAKYLKEVRASEVEVLRFQTECQKMLKALIAKLVERSPLKYKTVRGLSCLDPAMILLQPDCANLRMKCLLGVLYEANRVSENVAEKAKNQYSLLCTEAAGVLSAEFKRFHPNSNDYDESEDKRRLDVFYASILSKNPMYVELWEVVKLCLIFSHGNATVEGGFSINKSILVENLHEESLIAQRKVYDAIINAGGKEQIPITQKMLISVRGARRRYEEYLEENRKNQSEKEKNATHKRKFQVEIKKLEEERKKLRMKSQAEEELIAAKIQLLEKGKEA